MPPRTRNTPLRFALCLALVVATLALHRFQVADHDIVGPITTSGERDEEVATDDFTVEVTDVRLADTVVDTARLDPEPVEANGVWVVVEARVTATHSPINATRVALETADGTTYSASTWFQSSLNGSTRFSTAMTTQGVFVFEAPEDRLDSPALVLTNTNRSGSRLAAQASVDLGVDADDLKGERGEVELTEPETRTGESSDAPA
ncbi:hypothetical protein NE857_00225 [Nocardiopsis exhalans]|uniref:DUF4352 domain-containing protein n=1 Tax=Nocardiopsis exhalans TaxID=163604 RepID=A0ABY5D9F8_9ACTN|nr:hypothetical protein [Nocardiopsis exhalans]USY20148.1 hypothetical protein NE857_00225 [Nocardiopsis exhalans]